MEATPPAASTALLITGNPNVGKSVLFALLTGRYVAVSNYPGTTVMQTTGQARLNGRSMRVCDTPGLNTLAAGSEDEWVARELLLADDVLAVQVADAKNIARALVLTLELSEARMAMVLVLNMFDEARERRLHIDDRALSRLLGIPVVPMIATERWGLKRLQRALPKAQAPHVAVSYPPVIAQALARMEAATPLAITARRARLLLWLGGDAQAKARLSHELDARTVEQLSGIAEHAQQQAARPLSLVISQARRQHAERLATTVTRQEPVTSRPWLERAAALAIHPVWGLCLLAGVLAALYWLIGVVAAQWGVDILENAVFGRHLTPAMAWLVNRAIPWAPLNALLIGPYGLFTMALPYAVAIILPIVTMFFACFGVLEDVGYLPRLAIMANRFCNWLGLNGKAVLPLLLGLGCGTMATMSTRMLDSRRDRILATLLLALGIPCSAQLGVVMAMLAGHPRGLAVWAAVVLALVVLVGQLAARVIPGEPSPFVYELPPFRRPKLSNVLLKTLSRVEWYVREAVPLFFLGTLALFFADRIGLLARLEAWAQPVVVGWLRLPPRAAEAFLIGFLRRDFGAAGLYVMQRAGDLTGLQVVVSLVTITLFVPCLAQYLMMIKERGAKTAAAIAALSVGVAVLTGGVLSRLLSAFGGRW